MTKKSSLTAAEESRMVKSLNDFNKWLYSKKILKEKLTVKKTVVFPYANKDFVMKVEGDKVSFNTKSTDLCSFNYYRVTILHESFHLMVQKLPNKEDAIRVKDDFGDQLMKLIDIEADFYTALYHKEKLGFGLVKYLELYFEGRVVFSDTRIRPVKFERFIGSILSIVNMFILFPKKNNIVKEYDLYLPTIGPVYTEDSLHVLIIKREHIFFDEIKADHQDFVDLKKCYTNIDSLTKKGYVEKVIQFAFKALKHKIPKSIENDINKLTD